MSLARRAAIKLGFGAALAAPVAAAQLARTPEIGWPGIASGLVGMEQGSDGYASPAPGGSSMLLRDLRKLCRAEQQKIYRKREWRVGRFDHDVAVMGSWSLAFKAAVQHARDDADEGPLEKLQRQAWPEDE